MNEVAVLILIAAFCLSAHIRKTGRFTVGPGKGEVRILTGWCPRKAVLWFRKQPPIPGCSQLEDTVVVDKLVKNGFIIKYDVESGPRTIKWVAWKAWRQKKCRESRDCE